jgi:hypothetical protein
VPERVVRQSAAGKKGGNVVDFGAAMESCTIRDAARARDEIALRLVRHAFVRIASIPDGTQPDGLPNDELKKIFGSL